MRSVAAWLGASLLVTAGAACNAITGVDDFAFDGTTSGPCEPATCLSAQAACGFVDDGCGQQLDCGSCADPETCGGLGVANQCGCAPTTSCAAAGYECGPLDDGCGNTLECGACMGTSWCGGAGVANQCGCTPSGIAGPNAAEDGASVEGTADDYWSSPDTLDAADAVVDEVFGTGDQGAAYTRVGGGGISNWLVASGFGLAVPPAAVIGGIEVEIRRRSRDGTIADQAVVIVKEGVRGDANHARIEPWQIAYETLVYGGPTDLWGQTWTPDEINSPGFGVALQVLHTDISGNDDAMVDQVRVSVHFTVACP